MDGRRKRTGCWEWGRGSEDGWMFWLVGSVDGGDVSEEE